MDILLMDKLMIQQIVELINSIMETNMPGVLGINEVEITKLLRDRGFMYRTVEENCGDEHGVRVRRFAHVSKIFNSRVFSSEEIEGADSSRSLSLALLDLLFTARRDMVFANKMQWKQFVGIKETAATINEAAFFRVETATAVGVKDA